VTRRLDLTAATLVLVLGLATILAAWAFQIVGGYVPCMLCLKERIPYYVGLPLAALALIAIFAGAPAGLARLLLALTALAFLVGFGLGVYHAGAEWAFWAGPSTCGGGLAGGSGSLLDQLDNIHVVSCTEASWRFLGLSFAGWNAFVSLVLAVIALWGATRANPSPAA
jgi:disulfide bond formation protein DsbB